MVGASTGVRGGKRFDGGERAGLKSIFDFDVRGIFVKCYFRLSANGAWAHQLDPIELPPKLAQVFIAGSGLLSSTALATSGDGSTVRAYKGTDRDDDDEYITSAAESHGGSCDATPIPPHPASKKPYKGTRAPSHLGASTQKISSQFELIKEKMAYIQI